jgi:surface antigen
MIRRLSCLASLALALASGAASADPVIDDSRLVSGGGSSSLPPYLQCVPYARQVSGIAIYGDAHTWWGQAEGRYARGTRPQVGAVMAFKPHGNSTLGHVAAVSRIVDARTVLVRHANWSPINGRRGQIEDDVRVVDVSDAGDWSEVRVWYAPAASLGSVHWPVQGFIYPGKPRKDEPRLAESPDSRRRADPIAAIITRAMRW